MQWLLLKLKHHNLRLGADAHWRAPGAGAGAGVNLQCAEMVQAVGEAAKDAPGEQVVWEHLAAVGVA